jgi:hypothetical protein
MWRPSIELKMPVRQLRRLEPRFHDLGMGQAFLTALAISIALGAVVAGAAWIMAH